jgi:hypothetical protein
MLCADEHRVVLVSTMPGFLLLGRIELRRRWCTWIMAQPGQGVVIGFHGRSLKPAEALEESTRRCALGGAGFNNVRFLLR